MLGTIYFWQFLHIYIIVSKDMALIPAKRQRNWQNAGQGRFSWDLIIALCFPCIIIKTSLNHLWSLRSIKVWFLLYMMFLLTSISSGTTETRAMFRKPPAVKGRMYLEKTYHSRKSWFHVELFVNYKCIIFSHEQCLQIIAALKGERHEGPNKPTRAVLIWARAASHLIIVFFSLVRRFDWSMFQCFFFWHLSKPDFSRMAKSPNSWGICKYKTR